MIETIGILGSIASLVALFLPAQSWKSRAVHALYCFFIVALAVWITRQSVELSRLKSIEASAASLLKNEETMSVEGFIQASLAFLEKNRDRFPDAYDRAKKMCETNGVFVADSKNPGGSFESGTTKIELRGALRGLVYGISVSK